MQPVTISITNKAEIERYFKGLVKNIEGDSKTWNTIGLMGYKNVIKHFDDEKSPKGRWRELKKARKRGGSKILQDTGTLRASVRSKSKRGQCKIFTNLSYAGVHQFGSRKKNIPARSYLWIDKKSRKMMAKRLARDIVS